MQISVIIPVFNAAPTLARQMDAISRQEFAGSWEIIVADNGSTDESAALCSRYPRVRVVDASDQRGPGHARNVAVSFAQSDNLAFCDADDQVAPGWLAAMARALEQHEFVAGYVDCKRLNEPWLLQTRPPLPYLPEEFSKPWSTVPSGNFGIKRTLYNSVGGFDTAAVPLGVLCEDDDFSVRVHKTGARPFFATDAVVHYAYRQSLYRLFLQAWGYGRGDKFMYEHHQEIDYWKPPITPTSELLRALLRARSKGELGRSLWDIGIMLGRRGW